MEEREPNNTIQQQRKGKPFHITVAAAGKEGMNMDNDLRMLRSALIYGDQVKLCSYTTSGVLFLFVAWSSPTKHFLEWGEENIVSIIPDGEERKDLIEGIKSYQEILTKKYPDRYDLQIKMRVERDLAQTKSEMRERYPAITKESDIRGIQSAIKSNLLELYTFKSLDFKDIAKKHFAGLDTGDASDVVDEFVSLVSEAIENRTTYPLFDYSGNLVKRVIEDAALSRSSIRVRQAKHCALADNLLQRLPDFSETPIDELLDIRTEIRPSLDRFRSGVSAYAKDIQSAPWDRDFAAEADELFIEKVKPGVIELDDMIASNTSIAECVVRGLVNSKSLSGGAIGFIIDQHLALPKYIATALGYAIPTAFSLWEEFKNRFRKRREAQNHDLYFYYQLRDKVEK